MSEIRSVLPETKIFSTVTTRLRTCPRGNLITYTQPIGIRRKFTAFFLSSAQEKKMLRIKVHNISFLRSFEIQKSV